MLSVIIPDYCEIPVVIATIGRKKINMPFDEFKDNDMFPGNLRKAADVLRVATGALLSK